MSLGRTSIVIFLVHGLLPLLCQAQNVATTGKDKDSDRDGDGLSDFLEVHKYLTDPDQKDSDGDGVPDFSPTERREYTYTIEAVLRVLPPIDESALYDDFQDARVVKRTNEYVELSVVLYPLSDAGVTLTPDPNWRDPRPALAKYLAPGPTSNYDAAMKADLVAGLAKDGIDLSALDDVTTAARVARWLLDRAAFEDSFTTFAVEFENGRPSVARGLEESVKAALLKNHRSLDEQWNRELFGRGMYVNKIHGTCTSTAIYLNTGLRAAGIPTREIVCIPIVDASDPGERPLLDGVKDERIRAILVESTQKLGNSWASHTFNEVFVGGRWRRLNYSRLGQGALDPGGLGIMVHVKTFDDHANAGLVSWGLRAARAAKGETNDAFGHANPYSCESLSDRVGAHANKARLDALATGFERLTVSRLRWYEDAAKDDVVKMRLDDPKTAGHLVMHVDEGHFGEDASQFKAFYDLCGKEFVLRSKGKAAIPAHATRGYWVDVARGIQEFYLRIEPEDFAKMQPGVEYTLEYVDRGSVCRFVVKAGVTVNR